jgi:hypothetical protein
LKRIASPSLAAIAAVVSLMGAASCSVPLAPGYRVVKETRAIRFVSGPPPALSIHAEFTLVNSGNSALGFVDVRLPLQQAFGLGDLRVQVDGRGVAPAPLPAPEQQAQPDALRIAFAKPWLRKQKRELAFDYTLRSPAGSGAAIAVETQSFHLGLRGWAPRLEPPKHFLAPHPARPAHTSYTVRVPSDFAVVAGGAPKGRKTRGAEIEYRFELNKDDLGAFVVAGRYVQWPAHPGRNSPQFWTSQPLAGDPSRSAQQIEIAWTALATAFGPLGQRLQVPRVVESPALRGDLSGAAPAAAGFPGGALVNPAAFALGLDSSRFLQIVSEALARSWFDEVVQPSPEAAIGMGEGLPEYASIVADEARNGPLARRQRIYAYLRRYDDAVRYAAETPLSAVTLASPLPQRRIALAKAPLLYIELEDACGEAPVRAGLAHLLASLRGQQVDYPVLRSALEESTGRDLGRIFRQWLNQKGIPENFRARYPYGEGAEQTGN